MRAGIHTDIHTYIHTYIHTHTYIEYICCFQIKLFTELIANENIIHTITTQTHQAAHAKDLCNAMGLALKAKEDDIVLRSRPRDRGGTDDAERKCPWNVEIWTYTNTAKVTLCIRDPRHTCSVLEHVSRQKLPQQTKDIIASLLKTGLSERQVFEELTGANEDDVGVVGGTVSDLSAGAASAAAASSAAADAVNTNNSGDEFLPGVVKRHDDRSSQLTITDVRNIRVRLGLAKPDSSTSSHRTATKNNRNHNNSISMIANTSAGHHGGDFDNNSVSSFLDPSTLHDTNTSLRQGSGTGSGGDMDSQQGQTHNGNRYNSSDSDAVIESAVGYLFACHRRNECELAALRVVCKSFAPARGAIVRNLKQYHGVAETVAMVMDEKAKHDWLETDSMEPSLARGLFLAKRPRIGSASTAQKNFGAQID
jgi:hypothetical protein